MFQTTNQMKIQSHTLPKDTRWSNNISQNNLSQQVQKDNNESHQTLLKSTTLFQNQSRTPLKTHRKLTIQQHPTPQTSQQKHKNHSSNIKKPPCPPLAPLLDPLPGYPPGGRGGLGGPEAGEAPSELPLARTAGGGVACTGVSSSLGPRGWWSAWIIRVFSFFF